MATQEPDSEIEQKWRECFSEELKSLIFRRKDLSGEITYEMLGKEIFHDCKGKGHAMRVNRLVNGETSCSNETMIKLANLLGRYPDNPEGHISSPLEIESRLAVHAGRLMPSLYQILSEADLSNILDLISKFLYLVVSLAPAKQDYDICENIRWNIFLEEVNKLITGWLAIHKLEQEIDAMNKTIDEVKNEHQNQDQVVLETDWFDIRTHRLSLPFKLQTIYANTIWARILAQGGVTGNSDELVAETLNELNTINLDSDEIKLLNHRNLLIRADNARAKGMTQYAISDYEKANIALPPKDIYIDYRNRISIKTFNTYLKALTIPPKELLDVVIELCNQEKNFEIKARALYALAWFELSKRGPGIQKAIDYNTEGIYFARKAENPHLATVGNQYLGDAYFRLGSLGKAQEHLEYALKHYRTFRGARIGETSLLLGRVYAYKSMVAYMNKNINVWEKERNNAFGFFNKASKAFNEATRFQGILNLAYHRKQVLIEESKWMGVQKTCEAFINRRDFVKQDNNEIFETIENARTLLNESKKIKWGIGNNYYSTARRVNILLLDFFEWIVLFPNKSKLGAVLEKEIIQELNSIESENLLNPDASLGGSIQFSPVLDGHLARLYAILGATRKMVGLMGENSGETDIISSAILGSKDFPTASDCRWVISTILEPEDLRIFDSKLDSQLLEYL